MQMALHFDKLIEQQFTHNDRKSLFYLEKDGSPPLSPTRQIMSFVQQHRSDLAEWIRSAVTSGEIKDLLGKLARSCMTSFFQANQFIQLPPESQNELEHLYRQSMQEMYSKLLSSSSATEHLLTECFRNHYQRLRSFLIRSNGSDLFRSYSRSPLIPQIMNAEYTAEFQLRVLGLGEPDALATPILDIGCGTQAHLVQSLRRRNIDAYGLERGISRYPFILNGDWLLTDYGTTAWGTVISHMAFSNHFHHHHLRNSGQATAYAQTYMNILYSLKEGGCFAYAPGLPYFEKLIADDPRFQVITTQVLGELSATRVYRIQ
ncbi:hypothetical protein [Gorillibacterium timonense]|uniref:hypothetical protein n=1 Tax=Gorillibacterium timonense TaxID=1689269 RepID=UPI00071E2E8C|nr:hypothetical protein [Gorillibacterium timonense]